MLGFIVFLTVTLLVCRDMVSLTTLLRVYVLNPLAVCPLPRTQRTGPNASIPTLPFDPPSPTASDDDDKAVTTPHRHDPADVPTAAATGASTASPSARGATAGAEAAVASASSCGAAACVASPPSTLPLSRALSPEQLLRTPTGQFHHLRRCRFCLFTSNNATVMRKHELAHWYGHLGDAGAGLKRCPYCTFVTYSKIEISTHRSEQHTTGGDAKYRCLYCLRGFPSDTLRDEHQARHSTQQRLFRCNEVQVGVGVDGRRLCLCVIVYVRVCVCACLSVIMSVIMVVSLWIAVWMSVMMSVWSLVMMLVMMCVMMCVMMSMWKSVLICAPASASLNAVVGCRWSWSV